MTPYELPPEQPQTEIADVLTDEELEKQLYWYWTEGNEYQEDLPKEHFAKRLFGIDEPPTIANNWLWRQYLRKLSINELNALRDQYQSKMTDDELFWLEWEPQERELIAEIAEQEQLKTEFLQKYQQLKDEWQKNAEE